ncbi:MAG: DUF433 domain-containing protein [Anaerolineales bacterium]|nr:DUF433 domain-containing protein [Anaerolineales bacterium]
MGLKVVRFGNDEVLRNLSAVVGENKRSISLDQEILPVRRSNSCETLPTTPTCHRAFGKPTIRGLRYSVEWLLETLSSGMTNEEILADYEVLMN